MPLVIEMSSFFSSYKPYQTDEFESSGVFYEFIEKDSRLIYCGSIFDKNGRKKKKGGKNWSGQGSTFNLKSSLQEKYSAFYQTTPTQLKVYCKKIT